jgi:hypothetical protein
MQLDDPFRSRCARAKGPGEICALAPPQAMQNKQAATRKYTGLCNRSPLMALNHEETAFLRLLNQHRHHSSRIGTQSHAEESA